MEIKEVGRFSAHTFGDKTYEFVVMNNKRMYCKDFLGVPCDRISIQPRVMLFSKDKRLVVSPVPVRSTSGLICSFNFGDGVFEYLKNNNMIIYSTDMAYLYNLPDKNGYDIEFQKRAFKRVRNKEKILEKQKRGMFN